MALGAPAESLFIAFFRCVLYCARYCQQPLKALDGVETRLRETCLHLPRGMRTSSGGEGFE